MRDRRCPTCRIDLLHPEATIEIIGRDEGLAYDPDRGFRLQRHLVLRCGICGACWLVSIDPPVPLGDAEVVSFFAARPARRWWDR